MFEKKKVLFELNNRHPKLRIKIAVSAYLPISALSLSRIPTLANLTISCRIRHGSRTIFHEENVLFK